MIAPPSLFAGHLDGNGSFCLSREFFRRENDFRGFGMRFSKGVDCRRGLGNRCRLEGWSEEWIAGWVGGSRR